MPKLWQINNQTKTHPLVEKFTSADQVVLDQKLVKYDIYGSLAHAAMLKQHGYLTKLEYKAVKAGLLHILENYLKGSFHIKISDEDCHTVIENQLVKITGVAGDKIHTARSRNDQVLVALKLFIKDELIKVSQLMLAVAEALTKLAQKHEWSPMPGYTHMQKAMPSSVGLWLSSFAWLLLDDLKLTKAAYEVINQNPLGSGAGYGVSLTVDRQMTTQLLGFERAQKNVLSVQSSRGKIELSVLQVLSQVMLTLSKLAYDLLLFTTDEFGFFKLDKSLSTGSSIMPQKKNLDVMELVRAKTHAVLALSQQVAGVSAALPSGYNRDLQETKGAIMQGLEITQQSLQVCQLVVENLKANKSQLKTSMTQKLFATHHTYQLVQKGMSFRKAYQETKRAFGNLPQYKTHQVIKQMDQVGGPGNLQLKELGKLIKKEKKLWATKASKFVSVISKLTQ